MKIRIRGVAGWAFMVARRPLKTIKTTNLWRNSIVELHEDDERDAHVGVEDAEQQAESVE